MEFTLKYRSKIIINAYKLWIKPFSKVLDIGCGNAVVAGQLKQHFCCHITGTDLIDYRKKEIPFNLMAEENKLPFNDKEFDICMFNDTLHHCNDWKNMLNEAFRVGKRVLIFEVEPTKKAKILDKFVNKIHNPNMPLAINLKTSQNWRNYFEELNLDYEYHKIKKPFFFYPINNFSFNINCQKKK